MSKKYSIEQSGRVYFVIENGRRTVQFESEAKAQNWIERLSAIVTPDREIEIPDFFHSL